jgi:hypothetical protein
MTTGGRIEPDTDQAGNTVFNVENGTAQDAVVRIFELSAAKRTIRWFFVAAHDSAQTTKIPEGTFGVGLHSGGERLARRARFFMDSGRSAILRLSRCINRNSGIGIQRGGVS